MIPHSPLRQIGASFILKKSKHNLSAWNVFSLYFSHELNHTNVRSVCLISVSQTKPYSTHPVWWHYNNTNAVAQSSTLNLYHQWTATGLQCCQADTKDYDSGEGVVINESTAMGISVATIEGQVSVGVAGEEDRTEVDFEGDGLHPTVHTDIPLRCNTHRYIKLKYEIFSKKI